MGDFGGSSIELPRQWLGAEWLPSGGGLLWEYILRRPDPRQTRPEEAQGASCGGCAERWANH